MNSSSFIQNGIVNFVPKYKRKIIYGKIKEEIGKILKSIIIKKPSSKINLKLARNNLFNSINKIDKTFYFLFNIIN